MFLAHTLSLLQQDGVDEDPVRAGVQESHDLWPGQGPVRTAHDYVQVLHIAHDAFHGRQARPIPPDTRLGVVKRLSVVAALVDDPERRENFDPTA